MTLKDTLVDSNQNAGIFGFGLSTKIMIEQCTVAGNATGLHAGSSAVLKVSGTTITGNAYGLSVSSGGQIVSRDLPKSNTLENNGSDGSFSGTYVSK